jgi:NAD(P)-dependent dehydrogenase (short-subunit alcohol dehydrogenase family)
MAVKDVSSRTLAELVSLEGRCAVVTGGARGIGFATCDRLAEAGAYVIVADLDEKVAEEAADELSARHDTKVIGVRVDVADPEDVRDLADRVMAEFGGLDVWVNNAGVYPSQPVLEMTDEQWRHVLAINLDGAFAGSREAAKRMVEGGRGGVIVNITSTAAFRSHGPGLAHYVASKHALHGLTKSMAVELAPHGIRVLAVAPTAIDTPGVGVSKVAMEAAGLGSLVDRVAGELPLGRIGVADDIARAVLFCASDLSAFMTGSTVVVDAGDLVR